MSRMRRYLALAPMRSGFLQVNFKSEICQQFGTFGIKKAAWHQLWPQVDQSGKMRQAFTRIFSLSERAVAVPEAAPNCSIRAIRVAAGPRVRVNRRCALMISS